MAEQNSKVVGGGVVMLLLWGGLGLFFGLGKGKGKGDGKAKKPEQRAKAPTRQKPRERVTRRKSPLDRVSLERPTGSRKTQIRTKRIAKTVTGEPAQRANRFSYVLRLKYIHPVDVEGRMVQKTISLQQLVEQGKKAAKAKQELHLRVRGDARARWEKKVKQALRASGVAFSVTNEF